jgi:tetratricopeptide (TPR) repeat protein
VAQARDAAEEALGKTWNHARFRAQRTRVEQQLADAQLREALDGAQELLRCARHVGEIGYPEAHFDLASACSLLAQVLRTTGGSEQALPLLDEAQKRFEAVERVRPGYGAEEAASFCLSERGTCLLALGRLEEAATAYEESIRRSEKLRDHQQMAYAKGNLGSVRLMQHRYKEALEAFEEARVRFTRFDEPDSIAVSWHQTGAAYQQAGQPEAAEDAYRKSLAIRVRLRDVAGQADTLVQLGNLYDDVLDRPEQAVTFYRQAADKYVELGDEAGEGATRNNLGKSLQKLHRFEEARQEIRRAIKCKEPLGQESSIWNSWDILNRIEIADGNFAAAAEAKRSAKEHYFIYRRDGGENHDFYGRICSAVTQHLLAGNSAAATSFLQQLSDAPERPEWTRSFIHALQAIVAGSRDRTLADAPDLHYTMAAEILFLIETLEARE